jgi:hypothetical protein
MFQSHTRLWILCQGIWIHEYERNEILEHTLSVFCQSSSFFRHRYTHHFGLFLCHHSNRNSYIHELGLGSKMNLSTHRSLNRWYTFTFVPCLVFRSSNWYCLQVQLFQYNGPLTGLSLVLITLSLRGLGDYFSIIFQLLPWINLKSRLKDLTWFTCGNQEWLSCSLSLTSELFSLLSTYRGFQSYRAFSYF